MTEFNNWAEGEKARLIKDLRALGYSDVEVAFMVGTPSEGDTAQEQEG